MARALMGYVGNGSDHMLQIEVARLRRRVRELEAEVASLRTSEAHLDHITELNTELDSSLNDGLRDGLHQADPSLDIELHQLATSSAAELV